MTRQLRIEYPGALYHLTHRGNERKNIFADNQDRETFLEILRLVIERFKWLCHGYVLMDNHYHLHIETPKGQLSRGMMQLNSIYTREYNRRHNRVGHLFQGRFKSIMVDKESYLLELSRYIALNPVRAGLVERPEDWVWSSYSAMIGATPTADFLTIDWILSQFGADRHTAIIAYRSFVMSGIGVEFPQEGLVGQVLLGSDEFLQEMNKQLAETGKEKAKEIRREERYSTRKELDEIFQREMKAGKTRDEVIYQAYRDYDYTLREIGEYLELHYATISRAVRKCEMEKTRETKMLQCKT